MTGMTLRPDVRPEPPRPRRRVFSLNGLAIQLSAFALSSTFVALLVVSGSQAAFVEPSEALENYVPIGATATAEADRPRRAAPAPSFPAAEISAAPGPATETSGTPAPVREEPAVPPTAIELHDTDAGTAMFGAETVLSPGVRADRCIEVSYSGDGEASPVLLYAARTRGDLGRYLDLTIEMGPGDVGRFGGCGGFTPSATVYRGTLEDFLRAHSSYATGRGTWTPAGAQDTRVFRFGLSLRDDPASSGRSVAFGFTWETRDD